jgi:hypothetical protein
MKCLLNFKRIGVALCLLSLAVTANAQLYNLVNGGSVASIDPLNERGMYQWAVGNVNQLNTQWFWYRIGGTGPETPINTIGTPSIVQSAANQFSATYANNQLSLRVDYQLTAVSGGQAKIDEIITINNLTGTPLSLHFFQYSDFNLGGTPTDASVFLERGTTGIFRTAYQDGDILLTETLEVPTTPGAQHGQVSFYKDILDSLKDGSPTTLTDAAGPIGPGDLTWAFQWDFEIAGNSSATISKIKALVVPEPGAAAVFALGLIAFALRRRNA